MIATAPMLSPKLMPNLRGLLMCALFLLPAALGAVDQAINSICPVSGKAIDTAIAPVLVTVGKGERAKRVLIGTADRASADKVKANPAAYVEAARGNRKAP